MPSGWKAVQVCDNEIKPSGASIYVDPNNIGLSQETKVIATANPECSVNIVPSFGTGLANCRGGCGMDGVTDGCTCGGGNPKDSKSCWWRWTCTATAQGMHTASFNTVSLNAPASDVDADLAEMQRMGMKLIRVFAASKNINDNEAARRLGVFLDKAGSYGISVIVSFVDFYNSGFNPMGVDQYYTDTFNSIKLLNHEFFNSGYQGRYKDFVRTVVEANKNNANIYAWEVGNELKDNDSSTFLSFMRDVTGLIKSIDSSHLVATGMLNAAHTGLSPQALYSQLPNVDIVTVHTYNGDRSGASDVDWAKNNGKQAIIEEFGYSGTGDRSENVRNEINYWKDQGVSSVLQWGFIAKNLSDNGNGDSQYGMDTVWHTDYDALFDVYKNAIISPTVSPTVSPTLSPLACAKPEIFSLNNFTSDSRVQNLSVQNSISNITVAWDQVQPTATSDFNFSRYDAEVSDAVSKGRKVAITFCEGDCFPNWVRQAATSGHNCCSTDDVCRNIRFDNSALSAFDNFIDAGVDHFKGMADYFGYGLEPNCRGYDALSFSNLYNRFAPIVKTKDPQAQLILGHFSGADTNYISQVYQNVDKTKFDIVGLDPYGSASNPEHLETGTFLDTPGIQNIRNLMVSQSDTNKKIWVEEWGINSANSSSTQNEARQATLIGQGLSWLNSTDYIGAAFYHNFDCGVNGSSEVDCNQGNSLYIGYGLHKYAADGIQLKQSFNIFQQQIQACSVFATATPSASPILTLSPTPTITPISVPIKNIDINDDGSFDILDYTALVSCYGERADSSTCANKDAADLNSDGVVGTQDLSILIFHLSYGQ